MPSLVHKDDATSIALRENTFVISELRQAEDENAPRIALISEAGGVILEGQSQLRCSIDDWDNGVATLRLSSSDQKPFDINDNFFLKIQDAHDLHGESITLPGISPYGFTTHNVLQIENPHGRIRVTRLIDAPQIPVHNVEAQDDAVREIMGIDPIASQLRNQRIEQNHPLPENPLEVVIDRSASTHEMRSSFNAVSTLIRGLYESEVESHSEAQIAAVATGREQILITDFPQTHLPHPTVAICDRSLWDHLREEDHIFCLDPGFAEALAHFDGNNDAQLAQALQVGEQLMDFLVNLEK